jgi:hypothetical protein
MRLAYIKSGWKTLAVRLNKIIDAVNANEPVEGSGIRIIETANGKIIQTSASGASAQSDQPSVQYWHGVKWQNVDVMDSDCNKSTITVLVQTGNFDDSILIS